MRSDDNHPCKQESLSKALLRVSIMSIEVGDFVEVALNGRLYL